MRMCGARAQGWHKGFDTMHRAYYYNSDLGKSSWKPPAGSHTVATYVEKPLSELLPADKKRLLAAREAEEKKKEAEKQEKP
eukprot:1241256-Rhodomonas_salina.1